MANTTWEVHEHGQTQKLAENLWWVSGAVPKMSLTRCMTVARLSDGRLVIHNAVALDEASMRELEAWGTPAFLIVPSGFHRLDAPRFKQRYPQLTVLAPQGSRGKVEEVIKVDGRYEDFPPDDRVRLQTLNGTRQREGVMLVHSEDGTTVVLNDIVMNMDKKTDMIGYLLTTLMGSAPGPRVSRLSKLMLVGDPTALRHDLETFAALPDLVRVIVAHEKVAKGADAKACLQGAMGFLKAS
jgi:hypothetical protein